MGSSNKGGSSGTKHVNGTIACLIGRGPLYGLKTILLNAEQVWTGPIYRATSTNPVNLSTKYGTIRLFWGTEDQPADATLNGYEEHPPYKGLAYVVFVDFDHGQSTTAYNAEFICLAAPAQSVITGAAAAESLDGAMTVNPIVAAAEILTSLAWLGLSDDDLVAETFQAVADAVQAEVPSGAPAGRSAAAVSPLYDDATETRGALSDLAELADAWLRCRLDGKIECGLWRRDGNPPSVTTITYDDLSEFPEDALDDNDEVPNSFAVEFVDSEALHKDAKITVDDNARILDDRVLRRPTLSRPFLITYDQALRAGEEALRKALAGGHWTGSVRFGKAVTPEGAMLLPGDYLNVPISEPGETLVTRLIRITKVVRPKDATAPVQIEGDFDLRVTPGSSVVSAAAGTAQNGSALPPVALSRILALPASVVGATPPIHALACRPADLALGADVFYDDSTGGDFPTIGRQPAFALPVSLALSLGSAAATVRVKLLPAGANGESYRRDDNLLRDWTGGLTEGRNDELILVLLKKEGGGSISRQDGGLLEYLEVLSIAGAPTLVATDTFDVPVLRGRLGTTALDFTAGGFPDAWSTYEGWIISRRLLTALSHADFDAMLMSGDPGYFRLGAYSTRMLYSPAMAYAERENRETAELPLAEFAGQPDDSTWMPEAEYSLPPGLATVPVVGGGTYDDLP
jgi:hypothetical protein